MIVTTRLKLIQVAAAAFLLAGCGVFFAPRYGRWNPLDPENELITRTVELHPSLDGYVNQGDGVYHDDGNLRISQDAGGFQNASLLLFELGEIPVRNLSYIVNAELVLYCDSIDSGDYLVIYPIKQAWSSAVTYTTATSAIFTDNSIDVGNPLPLVLGSENRYSVFAILEAWYQGLPNNGLRLHGDPGYNGFETIFRSSNADSSTPRLVVSYLAQK